jgi:YD repeat-containing protein
MKPKNLKNQEFLCMNSFHRIIFSILCHAICQILATNASAQCSAGTPPPILYSVSNAGVTNAGSAAVMISTTSPTSGYGMYGVGNIPPGGTGHFTDPQGKCITTWAYAISQYPSCQSAVQVVPPYSSSVSLTVIPRGQSIDNGSEGPLCPNPGCSSCGMLTWSVSEPHISLWLHDEPLGYQPATGPRVSFDLTFNQNEAVAGFNRNIFSVGKRWDFPWLSYLTQQYYLDTVHHVFTATNTVVYFPGGRTRVYTSTNDYLTNTRLTGDTTNGFTLLYPDGSQDVYGFVLTNAAGSFLEAFLSQHSNPQGQKTTLIYYPYSPTAFSVRLRYVIDGDGRTNFIYYATNNTYSTNLISRVTDPFGRFVSLAYDTNGCLTNIIDTVGNSNSIAYDTNIWVTNLTTPYGTTSFSITDSNTHSPPNGRSILITQPDGGH